MADEAQRHRAHDVLRVGSPADRARSLVDLLRVGRIDRDRLRLAAFLGDEAAKLAVDPLPAPTGEPAALPRVTPAEWPALLERERVIVCVHMRWSGPSRAAATRLLPRRAALLHALMPDTEIATAIAEPDETANDAILGWVHAQPPDPDWNPGVRGEGRFAWIVGGRLRAHLHPAETDDRTFLATTVAAFGLGLPA